MDPEALICIAYALGVAQRPLGYAHEPFLAAVEETAKKMSAKQVSRTLRSLAAMGLSPGKAHSNLVAVVETEVCCEVVSKGLLPYQVITITAFADGKFPVCSAHESLVCALLGSIEHTSPEYVAATLSAWRKMHELGGAHERLVQPLRLPLLDAVALAANRMDARSVSNATIGVARMNCRLDEALEPLSQAIVREAHRMSPGCLSATLWACAMMQKELENARGNVIPALVVALESSGS